MILLGVDPGSHKTGWGIIETEGNKCRHIDNGVIILTSSAPLVIRVSELARELQIIVERYRPGRAAVEDIFVQKSARSALVLGQARGAALATLGLLGIPTTSHTSTQVKSRVTGKGRASKLQVAEMVTILLSLKEHPFEDAADALAVALCAATDDGRIPAPKPKKRGGARASLMELARAQGKM